MSNSVRISSWGPAAGIRFVLVVALTALAGCAGPAKVVVTQAPVEQGRCASFGWLAEGGQPASFMDQWIQAESFGVLRSKGYATEAASPDCLVTYSVSSRVRAGSSGPSVGIGAGGGGGHVGGGVGISLPLGGGSRETVNLTLAIIDARQKAQIWGGSLDKALSSVNAPVEEVRAAVQKILAEYPARAVN